jgi:hypothetical protein
MISDAKEKIAGGRVDTEKLKKEKAPRSEIKSAAAVNEEYEISVSVMEELERFLQPESVERLKWAEEIRDKGIQGILAIDDSSLTKAKALPSETKEERAVRKQAVADAKLGIRSRNAARKYYPQGIAVFDEEEFERLCKEEEELAEKKREQLKSGKDKEEIKRLTAAQSEVAGKIKALTVEHQHFAESTKVYTEACKFITQAENYSRFGELDSMYVTASAQESTEAGEAE